MLRFIEEHSTAIIATLVFHIFLVGLFNVWYIEPTVVQGQETLMDLILVPEELEEMLQDQQAEYEKICADDVTTGFKNLNMKERLERGKQVRLDEATEKRTTEQIEQELKELEQSEFDRLAEEHEPVPEYLPKEKEGQKEGKDNENVPEKGTIVGPATVTCDLKGRTEVGMIYIPAYLCRGQGKVVVEITVDQKGIVEHARIDPARTSTSVPCHLNFSKEAAVSTKFDKDLSAPDHQKGTITYIFLAQ